MTIMELRFHLPEGGTLPAELNIPTQHILIQGKDIHLSRQEMTLLLALIRRSGQLLSREEVMRCAWGYKAVVSTRTVDVHIQRLRNKIGESCIETVYRLGYRVTADVLNEREEGP